MCPPVNDGMSIPVLGSLAVFRNVDPHPRETSTKSFHFFPGNDLDSYYWGVLVSFAGSGCFTRLKFMDSDSLNLVAI